MPKNPKPAGVSASQSFTAAEVALLDELLGKMRRGSATENDLAALRRHPAATSLLAKVGVMQRSLEQQRELARRSQS